MSKGGCAAVGLVEFPYETLTKSLKEAVADLHLNTQKSE